MPGTIYLDYNPQLTANNTFKVVGNNVHYTAAVGSNQVTGSFPFVQAGRDVSTPKDTANVARVDASTYRAFGTGFNTPVILRQCPEGIFTGTFT